MFSASATSSTFHGTHRRQNSKAKRHATFFFTGWREAGAAVTRSGGTPWKDPLFLSSRVRCTEVSLKGLIENAPSYAEEVQAFVELWSAHEKINGSDLFANPLEDADAAHDEGSFFPSKLAACPGN